MKKMLIVIPLVVVAVVAAAALVLAALGVAVRPIEPAMACLAAALAGVVGASLMLRTAGKTTVETVQMALASTVIHMAVTGVLAGAIVAAGVVSARGMFVFWLIGAYWISLAALVWQLRGILVARGEMARAETARTETARAETARAEMAKVQGT